MGIKSFKPTRPARRFYSVSDFKELTKGVTPTRSLLEHQTRTGGRNHNGRITSRFRGGGHKKRYILAPDGLTVGDKIISSRNADIKPGNSMPLRYIPLGTLVHNVEMKKGKGGQLVRSAGSGAALMAKDGDYAQLRLPSGEVRMIHLECRAVIGQVSNLDHANISLGKAGRTRWLGKRPHNRGVTMNPVDHPMGGGEGRTSGGRHPCSPWGQLSKGLKTRNNKRTDGMIIKRRGAKG